MKQASLFCALNAKRMADLICQATRRICYASPGIQLAVAKAIVDVAGRLPAGSITVSVDFDERVMRMGYGDIEAVRLLGNAGVPIRNSPGLRAAVLIVDEQGFVFTPTALYLEPEPQSEETPNALRLSPQQINEVLLRLSPAERAEAMSKAQSDEEREKVAAIPLEVGVLAVTKQQFQQVDENLKQVPPVKFDVVRQVRVFEPYLQYVEIELTGAAIQRHCVTIPQSVQELGSAKDLEGRLRTTFQLIERDSELSSKALETELKGIRKNFTRSLGKKHGRVMLKGAKQCFEERIKEFRKKIETHQKNVEKDLKKTLDDSKTQVVEYYLPLAQKTPPDALLGQLFTSKPTEADTRQWLDFELASVFPTAGELIQKMVLDVHYKDVTFETLNQPGFLESVKAKYPRLDWDKAYNEFKAAGEKDQRKA